jgi:tetratricopeptide (TPR) repeat protein
MIVEAVCWFHPLVWWVGSRLVDERERACDEEVLRLGNEPQVYAEGILNVCKIYLESPLRCVSGVTGSDLKKRIHAIVTGRAATKLTLARKATLTVAAMAAVTVPLVIGMIVHASSSQAPIETAATIEARNSLNQGVHAYKAGDFDEAIESFKKATRLDPTLKTAELYLASAYAQHFVPGSNSDENLKYAELALQSFTKVLDKDPANITAIAGMAGIYQNTSQFEKAREAYIRNADLDHENPIPHYAVGAVNWIIVHNSGTSLAPDDRSRLIEEGQRYLDRALALNPDYEDAMWYQNLMLREGAKVLREKAAASQDQAMIATAVYWENRADDWSNRALEARKKNTGMNRARGVTGNDR